MTQPQLRHPRASRLAKLQQENDLFRRALQGTDVIVFSQDRDLRYTWIHNPVPGFSPTQILGKTDQEVSSPHDTAALGPVKQQVLKSGVPFRQEVYLEPNDVPSYYDIAIDPIRDPQGQIVGITCVAIDTTERKHRLEEERQARQAVEDALSMRDQFLAIAAHELKNPLTTLLGTADLLLHHANGAQSLNERSTHFVTVIKHQARRMNGLIDSLLDMNHLHTGTLSIGHQPVDVGTMLQRLVEDARDLVATSAVFAFDGPPGAVMIMGDEARLEQVFHNLISNAVKYSPSGGHITVRIECVDAWVHVVVSDQGIGIPEAAQQQLFQPFYRASNTQVAQGMGIGLYVAKEILTRHGGDIEVVSREGEGSIFTVRLPRQEAG